MRITRYTAAMVTDGKGAVVVDYEAAIARALAALREDEGTLIDWLVRFVRTASVYDPVAGTTEEPAARLVHELLSSWGW